LPRVTGLPFHIGGLIQAMEERLHGSAI